MTQEFFIRLEVFEVNTKNSGKNIYFLKKTLFFLGEMRLYIFNVYLNSISYI